MKACASCAIRASPSGRCRSPTRARRRSRTPSCRGRRARRPGAGGPPRSAPPRARPRARRRTRSRPARPRAPPGAQPRDVSSVSPKYWRRSEWPTIAAHTELARHRGGDLAGERALRHPVDVLRVDEQLGSLERERRVGDRHRRRADCDLDTFEPGQTLRQRGTERHRLRRPLEHLPVACDERSARPGHGRAIVRHADRSVVRLVAARAAARAIRRAGVAGVRGVVRLFGLLRLRRRGGLGAPRRARA